MVNALFKIFLCLPRIALLKYREPMLYDVVAWSFKSSDFYNILAPHQYISKGVVCISHAVVSVKDIIMQPRSFLLLKRYIYSLSVKLHLVIHKT